MVGRQSQQRQLRVAYVHSRNCYVALPQAWAEALLDLSRKQEHYHTVLELSWESDDSTTRLAFVGWDGAVAIGETGARQGDVLELDTEMGSALALPNQSLVTIKRCKSVPTTKRVFVEPLTEDDWEIMQMNAGALEERLLKQIKVVYAGQIIPVYVNSQTTVKIRVDKVEPEDAQCALMNIDTEVAIAPKQRAIPAAANMADATDMPATVMRAYCSDSLEDRWTVRIHPLDIPAALRQSASPKPVCVLRLLSCAVYYPLLAQRADPTGSKPEEPPMENAGGIVAAYVQPDETVERGRVACHGDVFDALLLRSPTPPAALEHTDILSRVELVRLSWSSNVATVSTVKISVLGAPKQTQVTTAQSDLRSMVGVQPLPVVKHGLLRMPSGQHIQVELEGNDAVLLDSKTRLDVTADSTPPPAVSSAETAAAVEQYTAYVNHLASSVSLVECALCLPPSPRGLLVHGSVGCGKSSFLRQLLRDATQLRSRPYAILVQCSLLTRLPMSSLKMFFEDVFNLAVWHAPSVLAFDDIDKLVPSPKENADTSRTDVLANLVLHLCMSIASEHAVYLVFSARSSAAIHGVLQNSRLLADHTKLGDGGKAEREHILRDVASHLLPGSGNKIDFDLVAGETEGYAAADLRALMQRAHQEAIIRTLSSNPLHAAKVSQVDLDKALSTFTPQALQGVKLEKGSKVRWSDIGGLHDTKRVLLETLEWPHKYAKIFSSSPLRLRSGILLYGFPGCGKTMLASAVAKECGLNFISVKGPELLNKYIGASEASVRELFERAQSARPCVLFFDEFDAIAPRRGSDNTGVTDRVVNQLLTQMDGAEGLEGVYVLAATSRPDLLDPALLRPGRLDKSLLCNLPTQDERLAILQAVSANLSLDEYVDLATYAYATESFSGADLQGLVYNAHLEAIHARIDTRDDEPESGATAVQDEEPVEYVVHPGTGVDRTAVGTRAERAAMTDKVSTMVRGLGVRGSEAEDDTSGTATASKVVTIAKEHFDTALRATRPSVSDRQRAMLSTIYQRFSAGRVAPPAVGHRATLA
ncbi:Peroxisome biosynthesis protein pex1 [Sorochytrium milnesiophthora]